MLLRHVLPCLLLVVACKPEFESTARQAQGATSSDGEHASSPPAAELIVDRGPAVDGSGLLIESVGIETLGGIFTPLLRAGCSVPCVATEVFSTAADQQST